METIVQRIIEITQEDIDNGIQTSCYNCPVALAIKRLLKPGISVGVFSFICVRLPGGKEELINTPRRVFGFIDMFDYDKKSVQPINVECEFPSHWVK